MTYIIHKDLSKQTKAYNIRRFKDQNGRSVEVRGNRLPRGKAFETLSRIQWRAMGSRLSDALKDAKGLVDELNSSREGE